MRPARARWILAAWLLALSGVGCRSSDTPRRRVDLPLGSPSTERRRIETLTDRLVAALNRSDLAGVLACHFEDALLLPPGEPPVHGVVQVGERYQALFARGRPAMSMQREELLQSGGLAVLRGRLAGKLRPKDGGDAHAMRDDFLMVLQRRPHGWRITHLIWNPSPP